MRLLLGFLIPLFLAAVAYGLPSSHIIGGVDAKIGEYPYMVSLRNNNRHFCGGSIINRRYVLTAAHCITSYGTPGSLRGVSVHAGTNFLNETGDRYTVEKATWHANFSVNLLINDIGVLRLTKDIVFRQNVTQIRLADTKFVETGDPCMVSGWGRLRYMGPVPNCLQKLNLRVYSQARCKEDFRGLVVVQDSHVCAFSQLDHGPCHGDSGSPLVARGIQIGIASFLRNGCGLGFPDVYTRVSSFKDWLAKNVKL